MTGPLLLTLLLQGQDPAAAPSRPGNVNLMGARLSAPSVQLGEIFELTITARLPGGHVVFFPDSLQNRNSIESAAPARATLRSIEGDSMELVVTYPLRGFAIGSHTLPQADLFLQRAAGEAPAGRGAATVTVGDIRNLPTGPTAANRYTRRPIAAGGIEVQPVLPMARPEDGFQPRPPVDVIGGNFGRPVFALLGLGALTLLIGFTLAFIWGLRKVRAWPSRTPVAPAPRVRRGTPREIALEELEAIRAQGLHRAGRFDEFYTLSTRVGRRYVEVIHPALGPWLTDRELIERLGAQSTNGVRPFTRVLRNAEVVRFGLHVPAVEQAEEDIDELRNWVATWPPEERAA